MSKHTHAFKTQNTEVEFQASTPTMGGNVLYISAGLTTLCMWLSAEDLRAVAHAMTMAADEAQMQRVEVAA